NNGPVTAQHVAFHATERPDAVAVVKNGRSITYAEFARDIRKFTHALRALGLAVGSTAAIDCRDAYFNWLLRLAFEQLRVVTAVLGHEDGPGAPSRARDFDIVLSKSAPADAVRYHPTTTAWLQTVLESGEEDHEPAPEQRPDDPVRIVVTSGTTGRPKRLVYTRRINEAHISGVLWLAGFTRRSRYLLALPVGVSAPAACVRAGGTVVIEDRMTAAEAIATYGVTHTVMPPLALKRLLDELPKDFAKPPELMILSFGAPISRTLREKALARLATDLCELYASNEANNISSIRGNAEIGTIFPGVRVEVVDEDDRPLPFGQAGQIRVRTDCMVDGYLDFPDAAGRVFKDGWFYAGDIGVLHDAHRLQVLGRSDDILNIGWRKFAPEVIEELVLKLGEVADVGVCGVPNRDGIEEVCIAVAGQRTSDEELLRRITGAFRGFQIGRFNVIKLPSIPRTANGKLQRKVLKDAVARTVRENDAI
ncbi:MAG TPA: class I adenylate-forming enzyme family protein, partial [Stellaceae bacterium]|nr:class I adenylate-forming enzyme family protein [Stellaceae bacterium]